MSEVKWIKITTDIFDDEKILLIENLPDAYEMIVVWFKLLCLAGKQNNCGVFIMSDRIPYTDKMLATIFRMKEATVKMALQTFEQFGMIAMIDGVITIPNWEKHQNIEQLEKIREQNRQRVAKHREKQAELSDVTQNVTLRNATDKIRIDKKEDKIREDKEKDNKSKTLGAKTTPYYEDETLNQAFSDFVDMRKKIKKPLTDHAIDLQKKKLKELSCLPFSDTMDVELAIKILNQSTMNSWLGLFALKENQQKGNGRQAIDWENV